MKRAVIVLALVLATGVASADPDPEIAASYVSGELRGTTAIFHGRYIVKLTGPTFVTSLALLWIPEGAAVTEVVVHAPDGAHRLALAESDKAEKAFWAVNDVFGSKRWAVLVQWRGLSVDVSIAGPHAATLSIEIEMQLPTCFFDDARHAQVPLAWDKILSPYLRRKGGAGLAVSRACKPDDGSDSDELWVTFPSPALANKPAGVDRLGAHAARIDLDDAHIARLELAIAKSLGEVPGDLATAIVVDSSRSMTRAQLDAQREIVKAYARAAGETQLQLVAYARTARAVLPSWTVARTAQARLDRELRALAPRNGSNIDAAFTEAARWLAQHPGTKRVVLITDGLVARRLVSTFASLAKRLPPGTLVHVVTVDESSPLEREQGFGSALAESTGGIAARFGAIDEPIDATMLVRPIRIDNLEISTPGWRRFSQSLSSTCGRTLDEGRSCTWWGEGDAIAGPLAVTGSIWGTPLSRVVTPDGTRDVELARELLHMNVLEEPALRIAQRRARALGDAWSFFGAWGALGGYAVDSLHIRGGGRCCGSSHSMSAPSVLIGRVGPGRVLPVVDLSPQFAHVAARCGLGDAHVEATIELTDAEIVDVHVLAPPHVTRCVEDEIWDTAVTPPPPTFFRASSRIVLVH